MQIEAKPRTVVIVIVAFVVSLCGYIYLEKTRPERAYKREVRRLRLIEEHQRLEIEVARQRATLDAMKKAAEDAMPVYELSPVEKQKKDKALEEMNKEQQ